MKVTFLSIGILAGISLSAFSEDWPFWRGPDHNGITREDLPADLPDELSVLWTQEVGIGFSSFAVAGDRVLTMGNEEEKDSVWCLDAGTGGTIWQHTYDCELDPLYYEGGPGGTPTVDGDAVYTLSKKGHVFRLDLETGEVVWSRDLLADHELALPEWSLAASPFVDGDRLILNAGRGGIALSKENGETLWLPSQETSGYSTVVPFPVGEMTRHLLFSAKSLSAINSEDGSVYWDFPWKSSRDVNAADPIVVGERLVVSSSAGTKMLQTFPDDRVPEIVWEQHDMKWYFNPGVLIDGHLYSLHGTTHRPTELMCTNVKTGEIVWVEEGYGSGGLVATEDHVIVFDLGKLTIFAATSEGFDPLIQQEIMGGKCWTAPVFAHGRIFCRNADGKVTAVGTTK
jgi:outer membrane protein assembly factor BamB